MCRKLQGSPPLLLARNDAFNRREISPAQWKRRTDGQKKKKKKKRKKKKMPIRARNFSAENESLGNGQFRRIFEARAFSFLLNRPTSGALTHHVIDSWGALGRRQGR